MALVDQSEAIALIGKEVSIANGDIIGIVVGVCITAEWKTTLNVVWWANGQRYEQWIHSCEVSHVHHTTTATETAE